MSRVMGRGRYATETYPEGGAGSSGSNFDVPLSNIAFVDYGTAVALANQNGFIGTPYATVQQALNAGFTSVYIIGFSAEDVVAPGFVTLTGMDNNVSLNSLTIPNGSGATLYKISIATLTAGDGCIVTADRGIGTSVFGTGGLFVLNGPGALSFSVKVDQLQMGDITMGAGGAVIATNTVFSFPSTVIAPTVEMFGCASVASMNTDSLNAQNSALTGGVYTTTGPVDLQDVVTRGAASFNNALGQPFNLDGFSNYWIKTNGIPLANVGEKAITDDLTP